MHSAEKLLINVKAMIACPFNLQKRLHLCCDTLYCCLLAHKSIADLIFSIDTYFLFLELFLVGVLDDYMLNFPI